MKVGARPKKVGGQEVLAAQGRAMASIRGRDKKKIMQPWETNTVIFEKDGYTICILDNEADLKQEGQLQGHCSGSAAHVHASLKAGVQQLLSLRGEDGVPHCTIHIKKVDALHKREYGGHTGIQTAYDGSASGGYGGGNFAGRQFIYQDEPWVVLSATGKGMWGDHGKAVTYRGLVEAWLDSLPAPKEPVKIARPSYAY